MAAAAIAVGAFGVGGALVWSVTAERESTPLAAAAGLDGEQLYQDHCGACHGVALEGQPNWRQRRADGRLPAPPHDPSGHTWHHPDSHLFAMTKYGVQAFAGADYPSDMPAFHDVLTDAEIVSILDYIKSTWPERIRAEQQRRTQAAARS